MTHQFPHDLLDDPAVLSQYRGWSENVYRDFLDVRNGRMTPGEFKEKYTYRRAILSLDMTGFTSSAIMIGELESFLRIVDAQRVCIPIMHDFDAELVRCFADDVVAVFEKPNHALDAAFEIHRRIDQFNRSELASENPTICCIGIGFGDVYAIGPNLAQGDEMNRASKLGEDIARANEILVTERAYDALKERPDVRFERQHGDDHLFMFYKAVQAAVS
jgi:class 3 adenylate cyclase